jgi:hypothetical protein
MQGQQARDPLGPDLAGCLGREALQRPLDQDAGVGHAHEDRPTAFPDHGGVGVEHAPAKQGSERPSAHDRAGKRPHQRPDGNQILVPGDDRLGQMVCDIRLHRLIAQRRDGALGERL